MFVSGIWCGRRAGADVALDQLEPLANLSQAGRLDPAETQQLFGVADLCLGELKVNSCKLVPLLLGRAGMGLAETAAIAALATLNALFYRGAGQSIE